ncbi:MAG: hypothetical protein AAB114_03850, partial [Chloroflexota bacterium]
MPRLGRLGRRLVLGSVGGALLAVALVAAIDAVALRIEFDRYSRQQQDDRAAQVVASLADAYERDGGWSAALLAPAHQLAAAAGASLEVSDAAGRPVAAGGVGMPGGVGMGTEMMRRMHEATLALGPELESALGTLEERQARDKRTAQLCRDA